MQMFTYDPNHPVSLFFLWNKNMWGQILHTGNAEKEVPKYAFNYERIGGIDPFQSITDNLSPSLVKPRLSCLHIPFPRPDIGTLEDRSKPESIFLEVLSACFRLVISSPELNVPVILPSESFRYELCHAINFTAPSLHSILFS